MKEHLKIRSKKTAAFTLKSYIHIAYAQYFNIIRRIQCEVTLAFFRKKRFILNSNINREKYKDNMDDNRREKPR